MLFIFSTPELIRNLWQLKTAVFLHWCLICAVPLNIDLNFDHQMSISKSKYWYANNCLFNIISFSKISFYSVEYCKRPKDFS